jgi:hypothetical protein
VAAQNLMLDAIFGHLNHNPHLHMMLSAGGLNPAECRWVRSLKFDRKEIMELWRFAITSYLWKAHRDGLLQQSSLLEEFNDAILEQVRPDWIIHITRRMSKEHFLKYAGRYIRRLPICQKNILQVTEQEVVYMVKDTRTKAYVAERVIEGWKSEFSPSALASGAQPSTPRIRSDRVASPESHSVSCIVCLACTATVPLTPASRITASSSAIR